jgi:hypothetical protein
MIQLSHIEKQMACQGATWAGVIPMSLGQFVGQKSLGYLEKPLIIADYVFNNHPHD